MTSRGIAVAVAAFSLASLPAVASAQDRPEAQRPAKPSTLFQENRPQQPDEGERPAPPGPARVPVAPVRPALPVHVTPPQPGNVAPRPAVRVAPAEAPPAAPLPVPKPEAEGQARQLLRELFAEEYGKAETSPPAAKALAAEMMKQAAELRGKPAPDEVAARYVLLHEASALALSARDHVTALAAADELGRSYAVDRVALKLDVLTAAAKDPGDAASAAVLVGAFFELVDDAVRHADLPGAAAILSQAETIARKSKSVALATDVQKRRKDLRDLQAQYRSLPEALEKLRQRPEDPVSNLTAGRFFCFVAGNWEAGLPMLAKGADQSLRTLATRDLQPPATAGAKAELADAWWDLAEQSTGRVQENLAARAAHWYRQAIPDLAGLKRTLAQKRVDLVTTAQTATGGRAGTGGAAAAQAGPAQTGNRLLELLIEKFPADLRPAPGQPFMPVKADEWFRKNIPPGTPISGVAKIQHSGGLQRNPATKKPFVTVMFRMADPLERGGTRYQLDVQARLEDDKALDAVKLIQGQAGELSGKISQCRIGGWSNNSQNSQLDYLSFVLLLDDVRFVPSPEE